MEKYKVNPQKCKKIVTILCVPDKDLASKIHNELIRLNKKFLKTQNF
jgi:hypothetical protein